MSSPETQLALAPDSLKGLVIELEQNLQGCADSRNL